MSYQNTWKSMVTFSVFWALQSSANTSSSTKFILTNKLLLPEFSVEPLVYRIGGALSLTSNDQIGYFGERFAIASINTNPLIPNSVTYLGFATGGILGLSVSNGFKAFLTGFQLDTVDAYYGFFLETLYLEIFGASLGFHHMSAHFGDGRFKDSPFIKNTQNFISLQLTYMPTSTLDLQLRTNAFIRTSLEQSVQFTAACMWRVLSLFQLETLVSYNTVTPFYEYLRFKLNYWPPTSEHRLVPYVLLHSGNHFFGQRAQEDIGLLAITGLELIL